MIKKTLFFVVLILSLCFGTVIIYKNGMKEGIRVQVGDEPYKIVTDSLLFFDLTTLSCPRCGSKEMYKEWHGNDEQFYAIGCKKCHLEGKIVEKKKD